MMKKLLVLGSRLLLGAVFASVIIAAGVVFSTGPGDGHSWHGGTGDDCTACHTATVQNNATFTISAPATFVPGATIDFDVVFGSTPGMPTHGFQVSVGDPSNHRGTLQVVDANTKMASGSGLYVTHNNNSQTSWTVRWQAPDPAPENITIWASGVAGNDGSGNNGDDVYRTSTMVANASLPVELVSFEAVTEDEDVLLRWATASESDNAGFEIEQAISPAGGEAALFENVGFVAGHGTSSEPHTYAHRVESLFPGRYLFRLKQIDFSGTTEYSDQVEVSISVPEGFRMSDAYPNPFNPSASINLAVARDQHVLVEAFDQLGRRVAVLHEGQLRGGELYNFRFDATSLPTGLYVLHAKGELFAATRSAILIK